MEIYSHIYLIMRTINIESKSMRTKVYKTFLWNANYQENFQGYLLTNVMKVNSKLSSIIIR